MCLNLWFRLLLNIPLHCHNIDKSDEKKWQLLVKRILIGRKNSNWKIFSKIFLHRYDTVLKSGTGCNIFPHPPHLTPPAPFMTRHCIYVDRETGTEILIHCIYNIFFSTLKPNFSCISKKTKKNSVLRFVIVALYLLFKYYRGFLH